MVLLVMLFNSIKVLGQQCQIMSPEENYCWTYPDADPDMFDNFVDAAGNVYSKYVPVSHYTEMAILPNNPCVRDAYIPACVPNCDPVANSNVFKTIRVKFFVGFDDNGTSQFFDDEQALTNADVDNAIVRLNAAFTGYGIRFRNVDANDFGNHFQLMPNYFDPPKSTLGTMQGQFYNTDTQNTPQNTLYIYVPAYCFLGTNKIHVAQGNFPFKSNATQPTCCNVSNGVIITSYDPYTSPDATAGAGKFFTPVLVHEVGHTLGLYHTFRGLEETPFCPLAVNDTDEACQNNPLDQETSQTYNNPAPDNNNWRGDFCADTPLDVTGTNVSNLDCSGAPAITNGLNYMNYADVANLTANFFTPQQAGRMHAYLTLYPIKNWLEQAPTPIAVTLPEITPDYFFYPHINGNDIIDGSSIHVTLTNGETNFSLNYESLYIDANNMLTEWQTPGIFTEKGSYMIMITDNTTGCSVRRLVNFDPCPLPQPDQVFTTNTLISQSQNIHTNLIVKTGATLTITTILAMQGNTKIVVERGGKLVLNNARIGNICGTWGGIQVWGNPTAQHSTNIHPTNPEPPFNYYLNANLDATGPGLVVLNQAIIENTTDAAIKTANDNVFDSNFWGGIIAAQNSQFRNCKRGALLMPYSFENYSYFKNCLFTSNVPTQAYSGVASTRTNGILFDNCQFNYTGTNPPTYRMGIVTNNAAITVRNGCTFNNLNRGIDIQNTNSYSATIQIGTDNGNYARNVFTNNNTGVYANTPFDLEIINNNFVGVSTGWGIVVHGSSGYQIKGNSFENHYSGIITLNTGKIATNNINCNVFTNNNVGMWALGDNQSLHFDANNYQSLLHDVVLTQTVGGQEGFLAQQGTPILPVFNLFTDNTSDNHFHIRTQANNTSFFRYCHPSPTINLRLMPKCDDNNGAGSPCYNNFDNINAGIVNPSNYPSCIDIVDDGDDNVNMPVSLGICQDEICLTALRLYLQQLKNNIDQGDKAGLLWAINTTPDADPTYQKYKEASPYLSDDVLKEVVYNTQMDEWKRADILLSNAPLSNNIMDILSGNIGSYYYDLLYAIKYYIELSPRDWLEGNIDTKTIQKNQALRTILRQYTQSQNYQQIQALLEAENTPEAEQSIIALKLSTKETTDAEQRINNLPSNTDQETWIKAIQQINLEYAKNENYLPNAEQTEWLRQVATNTATDQAAPAQALLSLFYNEVYDPILPSLDQLTAEKNNSTYRPKPKLDLASINRIQINPNPASNQAIAYLPPALGASAGQVQVFSLTGKLLQSIPYNAKQQIVLFSVAQLPAGIYLVNANGNGTTKLVVAH